MTKEIIDRLAGRALEVAGRQKVAICVSMVDPGGRLQYVYREENCSYFALESSRKKALTASQLKMPSRVVGEIGQKFPALKASFDANEEITGLPGGAPVIQNGQWLGGIGVAGGNFEQDHSIAAFAVGEK